MKQLVILLGTVLLGVCIFNMMAGDQPDSLKSVSLRALEQTMEAYG